MKLTCRLTSQGYMNASRHHNGQLITLSYEAFEGQKERFEAGVNSFYTNSTMCADLRRTT